MKQILNCNSFFDDFSFLLLQLPNHENKTQKNVFRTISVEGGLETDA